MGRLLTCLQVRRTILETYRGNQFMRAKGLLLCALAIAECTYALTQSVSANPQSASPSGSTSGPPVATVRPVVDDYYGTKVVDPYSYMENLKDPEVQTWFKGQDDFTRAALSGIPDRARLLDRIKQLDQSAPYHIEDVQRYQDQKYYYRKILATEEVTKLYERDGLGGPKSYLWIQTSSSPRRGCTTR
jgi:hypothetical protein